MLLVGKDTILPDFGPVWDMAGLRNFYGQGWRHSWLLHLLGLDLSGSAFVTKTTTADPRVGNTPLRADLMTVSLRPPSVVAKFWGGHTLNAWGLSGPGSDVVLEELARRAELGEYRRLQISFMPVGDVPDDLRQQTRMFVHGLKSRLIRFADVKLVVQLNASCPNTGHDLKGYQRVLHQLLDILAELDLPVMIKESVDTPFEPMRQLADHPACAGIVTTNCVKFGNLPERIPWVEIFGGESPLKQFGGGGYSGPYLLPLVDERVRQYRETGYRRIIAAGGGIRNALDARRLREAGADAICIGATLANRWPWHARAVIREAGTWSQVRVA
jgi:dihydroorotate dehydrogenase